MDNITNIIKQAAINNIGIIKNPKQTVNEDVKQLSKLQRNLQIRIQSTNNKESIKLLKIERNRVLTEIHNILKRDENEKINRTMKDLERIPHNNTKMYEAFKNINRMKPQQPLLIQGENGLTANPTEQAKIIAEHFRNTFFKNAEDNIPETPMGIPFTAIEISKAVNK